MNSRFLFVALAGMCLAATSAQAGDAAKGEAVFKSKCKMCHSTVPGKHSMGPSLAGIVGAKAASTDFPKYLGLKSMDIVWDAAKLDAFLADPKGFVGAKTMAVGLKKAEDRADVIAYLETLK